MVSKQMVVNFVPDGKTKGMSVISHTVDAGETAKGKKNAKDQAKEKKGGAAAAGADGQLSKKDLKKLEKKAKKADAKAGGAAAAEGGDKNKKGKKEKKPAGQAAAPVQLEGRKDYFEGPAADLWENLLKQGQWFGGAKPS